MPGRFEANRYWRTGMLAAIAGHLTVGALTLTWPLLILAWSGAPRLDAKPQPITFEARTASDSDRPAAVVPANDVGSTPSMAEYVEQRIAEVQRETEAADPEDSVKRLQRMSGQLEKISNEESMQALSNQLSRWLGNASRADKPAPQKAEGEFDFGTAQLHDVLRTQREGGGYDYRSILIDSAGRTLEVPLGEDEGARLYRIWDLIKKNPLLETVYRQVVMGLLDSLIKSSNSGP